MAITDAGRGNECGIRPRGWRPPGRRLDSLRTFLQGAVARRSQRTHGEGRRIQIERHVAILQLYGLQAKPSKLTASMLQSHTWGLLSCLAKESWQAWAIPLNALHAELMRWNGNVKNALNPFYQDTPHGTSSNPTPIVCEGTTYCATPFSALVDGAPGAAYRLYAGMGVKTGQRSGLLHEIRRHPLRKDKASRWATRGAHMEGLLLHHVKWDALFSHTAIWLRR